MPWQQVPIHLVIRSQARPLMAVPTGAFPVPGAVMPDQFPPAVKESVLRILDGPPKPAVSAAVMEQAQRTMVSPDLVPHGGV